MKKSFLPFLLFLAIVVAATELTYLSYQLQKTPLLVEVCEEKPFWEYVTDCLLSSSALNEVEENVNGFELPEHVVVTPEPEEEGEIVIVTSSSDVEAVQFESFVINTADSFDGDPLEGVPPVLTFNYDPITGALRLVIITVGHETWSKEFTYFFSEQGKIIQYQDSTEGRPDNLPDIIIFYSGGQPTTTEFEPVLTPEEIVELYTSRSAPTQDQLDALANTY